MYAYKKTSFVMCYSVLNTKINLLTFVVQLKYYLKKNLSNPKKRKKTLFTNLFQRVIKHTNKINAKVVAKETITYNPYFAGSAVSV